MDDEDEDGFGGFGGGADDEVDTFETPVFTANAMQGSGKRQSVVSNSISLQRTGAAGTDLDACFAADLVATGTTADVGSICKELRLRWEKGRIYSNVGAVLLATNPYRNIFEDKVDGSKESVYSDRVARGYFRGELSLAVEPHVFGVAANAYKSLVMSKKPQCIVISGDSGAGKTETAKQVMHYLAVVAAERALRGSSSSAGDGGEASTAMRRLSSMGSGTMGQALAAAAAAEAAQGNTSGDTRPRAATNALGESLVTSVVVQLLESNVILETFGNAETVRSFNSSRFGKYVEVMISDGDVVGATMTSYLLEKGRVVGQAKDERSFHAFYQLLCGHAEVFGPHALVDTAELDAGEEVDAEDASAAAFKWEDFLPTDPAEAHGAFPFLTNGLRKVPGVDDGADLSELVSAMRLFMPHALMRQIFRLLTALLHLGNLKLQEDSAGYACVAEDESLVSCCALLGVERDALRFSLTNRQIQTGNRGSIAVKQLEVDTASVVKETLAKSLYAGLFHHLIATMNVVMAPAKPCRTQTLGTLDIYGFEILANNSLEQFLINFVNEKLQALFIDRIMQAQQDEYLSEGLDWNILEFRNNTPTCQLLEKKQGGILSILDEQCAFKDSTAKNFVGFLQSQCQKHQSFEQPGRLDPKLCFKVRHYAGTVAYNAELFIDKNRDEKSEELVTLMLGSNVRFFADVLLPRDDPLLLARSTSAGGADGGEASSQQRTRVVGTKKLASTMGKQFKLQVASLMATLEATEPHFIRCLKPNEEKKADLWDEKRMHEQVIFNGIPENIRIAQKGFVMRVEWADFVKRYKMLSKRTWPHPQPQDPEGDVDPAAVACLHICEDAGLAEGKYLCGKVSKIFIKDHETAEVLEQKRRDSLHALADTISKVGRGYPKYKKFKRTKEVAVLLQRQLRGLVKRVEFQQMKRSALLLQRQGRGFTQRKAFKELKVKHTAAKVFTNFAIGWSVRHRLPKEWKDRIAAAGEAVRVRKRQELKGCVALQSLWRAHKRRAKFLRTIKSVVVVQSLERKRTSKKVVAKLRQTRKELDSCVKLQSAVRRRSGQKKAAKLKQDKKELKSALRVQTALRVKLGKNKAAKLRRVKFERDSSVKIQAGERMRQAKKKVAKIKQDKKESLAATKIQAHERKLHAEKEWKATRKAIHLIGLRLRMKLARLRMHHTKVQQLLLYKLQIIQGLFVTRLLPDGAVSSAQQKVWCDPAFTQLRISWLPPAKGKAKTATDKGGKRPDEHPMVLAGIVNVENLKGDALNTVAAAAAAAAAAASAAAESAADSSADASVEQPPKWAGCVVVTHKDGRVFSFGFAEASVAACVATGLRSNADPVAQRAYVQALIHEHK